MLKISDALDQILGSDPILKFGLHHQIFNLSALSRVLVPLIAARTKKEVSESAVTMALSRFQRNRAKKSRAKQPVFKLQNLGIQPDLAILTFDKTREGHRAVQSLYQKVQKVDGYLTLTEGMNEITVIVDAKQLPLVEATITFKPHYRNTRIACVWTKFDDGYLATPGFLFNILQNLAFQGINVIELASTTTELLIYLDRGDARLAFDTLYAAYVEAPRS